MQVAQKIKYSQISTPVLFWILFTLGFALAYSFPLANQTFDSLTNLFSAQQGVGTGILADHPLANIFLNSMYQITHSTGLSVESSVFFQIFNAILFGLCGAFFYYFVHQVIQDQFLSVSAAFLLFLSNVVWYYAKTAEIYMLIVLVNILVLMYFHSFIHKPGMLSGAFLGGLLSAIVLLHRANLVSALILFAALALLCAFKKISVRNFGMVGFVFLLCLAVGYVLLGFAAGNATFFQIYRWAGGYLSGAGLNIGADNSLREILPTGKKYFETAIETILSKGYSGILYQLSKFLFFAALIFFQSFYIYWVSRQKDRTTALFHAAVAAIWIFGAIAIFWGGITWRFEPDQDKYWNLFLPAFIFTLIYSAYEVSRFRRTKRIAYTALALMCLGLFTINFRSVVYPNFTEIPWQRNADAVWKVNTRSHDLLIVGTPGLPPYLRYSGWNNVIYIPQFVRDHETDSGNIQELVDKEIDAALLSGNSVYVTSDIGEILNIYSTQLQKLGPQIDNHLKSHYKEIKAFEYLSDSNANINVFRLSQ